MLFRSDAGDERAVIAVTQPGHAWLAGQIVRAWGNEGFARPSPFEEVCLGAELHDIAWLAWEAEPTLNPATGLPHQFHEVPTPRRVADWRRGVRLALAYGRYPALLVSLHADTIYGPLLGSGGLPEDDLTLVRALLDEQHAFQRTAREALASEPHGAGPVQQEEMVERNRLLLAAADGLSLAVCRGVTDEVRRAGVPRDGAERVELRLRSPRGDPEELVLEPWPFGAERVELVCEGRRLRGRFADEGEMRAALEEAERVTVAAVLRPC